MRIALAQINPTVGDLAGNRQKIVSYAARAAQRGADLVVFPELCVTGYPPQDLLDNPLFRTAVQQTVQQIASDVPRGLGIIVGAPLPNPSSTGKRLQNVACLFEDGRAVGRVAKRLLPTYDVFDEHRYFEPGTASSVIEWRGHRLGLHICEDMWNAQQQDAHRIYDANPVDALAAQAPDLFINISASPFSLGKHAVRTELVQAICAQHQRPFLICNQVGANTEIIFDGDSRVHAPDGTLVACADSFAEDLLLWDTASDTAPCSKPHDDIADLHDALVLGIRDYFHKTGIFNKALVGLSGGIDSAVTCALAAEALGPEQVVGVTMPSEISSKGSVTDSEALAHNLGIAFRQIPIKPAVDAFDDMLAAPFEGTTPGVAEENIQSRVRGTTLMALSNKFGHLLLSTGNKSEMAVGYVTLYGDTNGGVAVLSDVLKTRVYALARHMNAQSATPVIPQNTIDKPPSAELRPDQQDTDSLPSYDVLDEILRRYIESQQELATIVEATGFEEALVADILQQVDRNEYKRRQAPPGLRVTEKAFGMGRRMPIVMQWERMSATTPSTA
ncbi:NAD+ synthase [Salisaeta longa]|uniref:NAD+ synthase n=1 Tax=Salisaeta longa TaxID=503170 RepID=UPI0003B485BF|nr:NAD+ synthase [Salisaeta longa]